MNKLQLAVVLSAVLLIGIAGGWGMAKIPSEVKSPEPAQEERKPLYWVAPMDANYRRDKPGLSPMGMALLPVYAEDEKTSAGMIKIDAAVINNLNVRDAVVEKKSLSETLKAPGVLRYDEDRLRHIHPRVSGWIDELYVKASGDPVHAGEPLYRIYSPQLVSAQDDYLLALNGSNARLISAAEGRLRALHFAEKNIAELKRSREVKQSVTFYSPDTGVIENLSVREGFYVEPGLSLFSIASLDTLWLEADILSSDISLIKKGMPVSMKIEALPGRHWSGEIDYLYPMLDAKNRSLRVRVRFENAGYVLKPNMQAEITIQLTAQESTLVIDRQALIRTAQQSRVVLALGDGKFESVVVQTGRVIGEKVEILQGLSEGQKIVVSGQFLLDSESQRQAEFLRMGGKDKSDDQSSQHAHH